MLEILNFHLNRFYAAKGFGCCNPLPIPFSRFSIIGGIPFTTKNILVAKIVQWVNPFLYKDFVSKMYIPTALKRRGCRLGLPQAFISPVAFSD